MMTHTDRRRFPVLFAGRPASLLRSARALAAAALLALSGALALPATAQAQTVVTLHLSLNQAFFFEDTAPSAPVTATVAPASPVPFTVTISATPVAPATEDDFTLSTNRVLSFAANATASTGTVTIRPVPDEDPEPHDVVTVSGAVSNAAIPDPDNVTFTIINDDLEPFDVAVDAPAVVDEDAGTATVTVTLMTRQNSAPVIDVDLYYFWQQETATRGDDYTLPSGPVFVSSVLVTTLRPSAFSPNAAGTAWVAQHAFTIGIVNDREAEVDETIVFFVTTGVDESPHHTITIRDDDPIRVTSVVVASAPQSGDTYRSYETIVFTVTFSEPVKFEPHGRLRLEVGLDNPGGGSGSTVEAGFWGQSKSERPTADTPRVSVSRHLHFEYKVQLFDRDADGVSIGANALRLASGARIQNEAGKDAELDHAAFGWFSDHKVDGSADVPMIERIGVVSTPRLRSQGTTNRDTYGEGENIRIEVRFDQRVHVEGDPTFALEVGDPFGSVCEAYYESGSGTDALVFAYLVLEVDVDRNGIAIPANPIEVVSGESIRNAADQEAHLSYRRKGTQRGHKVDGSRAAGSHLSVEDAEAHEADGKMEFTVRLEPHGLGIVRVDYATRDGSARAGSDYTETSGRLRFNSLETERTVSVPISDDAHEDDGETFTLRLSNPDGAKIRGDDGEATGTIRNSEALTASFDDMPETHDRETAFTFRVAFSEDVGISFQALREDAFTVSGGRVTGGKRVDGRRDLFEMTVAPDGGGDVTITLEADRDCAESGAICTKGENRRKLTNAPSATVRGPAAAAQEPQEQEQKPPDQEQKPQEQAAAAEQEPQQQEQPDQEEEEAAAQEPPQKPPPAPRNLTGVANGDGSVTLSWDAPGDDSVTGYRILRRHTVKQAPGVFSKLAANTGTTATTYTDRVASPETRYAYRVKAINAAGAGKRSNYVKVTTKRAAPASKPALADGRPGLAPNAPNPFNASTLIPYRLDADGPVRLEIYNLLGQRMRTLVDEVQAAGAYRVRWDARDGRGAAVAAGVYFIRLHHPGGVHTRRMLYLE